MKNTQRSDQFDRAFAALNPEQKTAVETIDGPVMVVAGPGTGKTQVLALRVANILRKTHMRPSNILCLTYSLNGAAAMRDRLRSFIGSDAYGIEVTTVHGFCNDLIRRTPDVFASMPDVDQLSDVERFHFMNKILDQFSAHSPLIYPKDRYRRSADILRRISEMKREGKSPDDLRAVAATYRAEMETKSREGTKAHERNLRMARQFDDFIEAYASYELFLKESDRYDYEDMILWVIRALEEEDWLRAQLQERYQYVLVDEFQDLNGAQNRIIELLASVPEAVEEPNLFVVGDDDQAIYRFQGANVESMLRFREQFPSCTLITLTRNYRSTQQILDASLSLIARNSVRVATSVEGVEKSLVSAGSVQSGPVPSLRRMASDAVEPAAIAEWIDDFLKEGIAPQQIAVFARTNHELPALHEALQVRGIPSQLTGKMNMLSHPIVHACLALLRAIADPRDNHLLSSALSADVWQCHPVDVSVLLADLRVMNDEDRTKNEPRRDLVDLLPSLEARRDELRTPDCIIHARDTLLTLSQSRDTLTLPDLLERLLKTSGLIPADHTTIDPLDLAALQAFFDFVKSRCGEDVTFDLDRLLREIETRQEYGLSLSYAVPHVRDDAVQVMTAHASKGLEFDAVILAGFREKHWDNKRKSPGLSMPEHLLFEGEENMTIEDERRLAFVAWTRARKHLLFSCPERMTRGDREQSISPSQFFAEGGALSDEPYELRAPERASTLLLRTYDVENDDELRTFLKRRLQDYRLSLSSLNKFLADPIVFLREDLLLLPQARNPSTAYGTSVHTALLEWGRHMRDGISREKILAVFEEAISRQVLTKKQKEDFQFLGRQTLSRYIDDVLTNTKPEIYALEKTLTAHLDDIPLTGKIDRIDLYAPEGAKAHIIDYKTGSPKTEREIREGHNGDLYRQLVFYKLLSERSPAFAGYQAVELSLEFVGERDEGPRRVTFSIPSSDVRALEKLIRRVWTKMTALDFTPLDIDGVNA